MEKQLNFHNKEARKPSVHAETWTQVDKEVWRRWHEIKN